MYIHLIIRNINLFGAAGISLLLIVLSSAKQMDIYLRTRKTLFIACSSGHACILL